MKFRPDSNQFSFIFIEPTNQLTIFQATLSSYSLKSIKYFGSSSIPLSQINEKSANTRQNIVKTYVSNLSTRTWPSICAWDRPKTGPSRMDILVRFFFISSTFSQIYFFALFWKKVLEAVFFRKINFDFFQTF